MVLVTMTETITWNPMLANLLKESLTVLQSIASVLGVPLQKLTPEHIDQYLL